MSEQLSPEFVIVLCGKRKSGKDYVGERIQEMFKDRVSVLRLTRPIKEQFAREHGLDLEKLMGASAYKERYRRDMVVWGESIRNKDCDYFCRIEAERASQAVWLVCDARRPTDMEYFKRVSKGRVLTVRIVCPEAVRVARGWVFTDLIDNSDTECALDDYVVDMTISNDGRDLTEQLEAIRTIVNQNTT